MGNRIYICHRCGKRLGADEDYVLAGEKDGRSSEDREHVECSEQYWQKMRGDQKLPTPGKGGGF